MIPAEIVAAIASGRPLDHQALDALDDQQRAEAVETLLESPAGRRWLRLHPGGTFADRLLEYEDDFRQKRRDYTLAVALDCASEEALIRHARAIAAGPAAVELWSRFDDRPDVMTTIARDIVQDDDPDAAEAALYLLVLDPLDPYRLGTDRRGEIASAALGSAFPVVRGLAAEYLAGHDPGALIRSFDALTMDEDQRVRGIVWTATLAHARSYARERAIELLGDETAPVPVRRSALIAIGTHLPTSQVIDILTYLVVHPDPQLASDAADLLYNQHRNPVTAEAARMSPHEHVRDIAEVLLDPLRGSPAAGGSRPGDPTRSTEIFADMVRRLEEREEQLKRQQDDG